ncbi:hypothetical protein VPHD479_0129 [Vibrio phage D479]
MGDMADMALDYAFSTSELAEEHRYSDPQTRYDLGLVDEQGNEMLQSGSHLVPTAGRSYSPPAPFHRDRLHHHTQVPCIVLRETEKAFWIKTKHGDTWVPKKLSEWNGKSKYIHVWRNFWKTKLKEMS